MTDDKINLLLDEFNKANAKVALLVTIKKMLIRILKIELIK